MPLDRKFILHILKLTLHLIIIPIIYLNNHYSTFSLDLFLSEVCLLREIRFRNVTYFSFWSIYGKGVLKSAYSTINVLFSPSLWGLISTFRDVSFELRVNMVKLITKVS